ncbi:hypothetical protein PHSY_004877 [Pseudozyma hubeiensis SY62]|uniref:Uncharacterized protein n=1 Tax=Pseudozyma hubeiensis (strain SY62) TaxID=1305764 RepID=R9P7R5_PSEHS|nr:hypothetical protein PHSY_004877 [Pseudozyma hubeiensis SY62]GAC97292.1 hypothetical protein PHSY_004877 [Pseudozyma hubeiensis SY62]
MLEDELDKAADAGDARNVDPHGNAGIGTIALYGEINGGSGRRNDEARLTRTIKAGNDARQSKERKRNGKPDCFCKPTQTARQTTCHFEFLTKISKIKAESEVLV